jgi:hypothetical protein
MALSAWLRARVRRVQSPAILFLGWTAFLIYAYPGQVTWDGVAQLLEARTGVFTDAQPPANAALWTASEFVLAGTFGMLVIQSVSFLAGAYLVLRRTFTARGAAGAAIAILLFPPVLVPLAVVGKESTMAGFLMLGIGLLLTARRRTRIVGLVAIAVASAVRYEACIATLPVVLLSFRWPGLAGVKRYAVSMTTWLAVTACAFGYNACATDHEMSPWRSTTAVYDIVGTLDFVDHTLPDAELERLLAGTDLQVHHDIHATARAVYDRRDYIRIISDDKRGLWRLPLFGHASAPKAQLDALARAWREIVTTYPGAYLKHRLAVMKQELFLGKPRGPIITSTRDFTDQNLARGMGLATGWSTLQITLTRWFASLSKHTPLFVPWIYVAIALALLPLARRQRDVLVILLSGLALELAQLFTAVARNYAYSAWVVACACIGVVVLVARRARAADEPDLPEAVHQPFWEVVADMFRWIGRTLRTASPRTILLAGWLGMLLYAHPGYMSYDSVAQLLEARSGVFSDGHPPAMAALWRGLDFVVAGPIGILLLQTVTFLGGTYLLLRRFMTSRAAAVCASLVLWFPPISATMGVIWKDCLMAGFLVLGTALLISDRRWTRILGLVVLAAATATRHNALAMTLPLIALLFVWNPSHRWWKRYPIAIAAWVAVTLSAQTFNGALTDRKTFIWHQSLALYDMVGTLRFAPDIPDSELHTTFAGITVQQTHDLQALARTPFDRKASFPAELWGITDRFFVRPTTASERDAIVRAWKQIVLGHPQAYATYRWQVFRELVQLTSMDLGSPIYRWFVDIQDVDGSAARMRHSATLSGIQHLLLPGMVRAGETPLFRVYVYLFASLLLLGFAIRDRVILSVLLSGLSGESALFILTPTTDFRYSSWLIVATMLAVVMLVAKRARAGETS